MLIYTNRRLNSLGCVPCQQGTARLGDLDFGSAGLGAGTLLAMAAAGVALFAVIGRPAKERRSQLAAAKAKYTDEVKRIKSRYGRLGRRDV